MEKEMMYWYEFCLFKEQIFKQSADDIKCWYIRDFLSLPKCSSILVVRCRCV